MAFTEIFVGQLAGITPLNPTENLIATGAGNGYKFKNNGKVVLHVRNSNVAARTFTVLTGSTPGGFALNDATALSAAGTGTSGGVTHFGPFPPEIFNNPADGMCYLENASIGTDLFASLIAVP